MKEYLQQRIAELQIDETIASNKCQNVPHHAASTISIYLTAQLGDIRAKIKELQDALTYLNENGAAIPLGMVDTAADVIHPEIAAYGELHDTIRRYIDAGAFVRLRNFMFLFNNENTDANVLKTILVITKSFKEHAVIKDIRKNLLKLCDKKTE